ncbi:glycine cleavage system protein GcvH [Halobacterium wangiae]|uniref:glycine cleavage system protein GcvH n=1 Tax=Halobacterium wangiae TaxID=2902623 RepID=UPI001E587ACE|nr:glycine cleavage system protein GcvH [Halobacterium wangiae]
MSFDVPDDLYYLESHEWIDPQTGRVGISDFAQDELGDVVFVELPAEGDELDAEDAFGVVESIKAVSDIYAPVGGEVTAVNDTLEDQPELVNEDPFGDGWLVELDFDEAALEDLLSPDDYRDQIA